VTHDHIVGKKVVSSTFGVGVVVSVEQMAGGNYFYVIESDALKAKTFVPVSDDTNFRLLGTKEELEVFLTALSSPLGEIHHASKKDRINDYKKRSLDQRLEPLSKILREMYELDDLGSSEERIFEKLLETLTKEVSIVFNLDEENSRDKIIRSLKGEV